MKFYQIAVQGQAPNGPLFESLLAAQREVRILKADDRRYADEAMREAGIEVPAIQYEIVPVER